MANNSKNLEGNDGVRPSLWKRLNQPRATVPTFLSGAAVTAATMFGTMRPGNSDTPSKPPAAATQTQKQSSPPLPENPLPLAVEAISVRQAAATEQPQEVNETDSLPSYQPQRFVIELGEELLPYLRYGDEQKSAATGMSTPSVYLDTSKLGHEVDYTDPINGNTYTKVDKFKESQIPLINGGAEEVQVILSETYGHDTGNVSFSLFSRNNPTKRDIGYIVGRLADIHKTYEDGRDALLTAEQKYHLYTENHWPNLDETQRAKEGELEKQKRQALDQLQRELGIPTPIDTAEYIRVSDPKKNRWIVIPPRGRDALSENNNDGTMLRITEYAPRLRWTDRNAPARGGAGQSSGR